MATLPDISQSPFGNLVQIDPVEAALMDLARALQLTPSMHREATRRYDALAVHVDRNGSPLEDRVSEVYPSGSFAIHAAIRSDITRDQHDVDAVLELCVRSEADPERVLDELYSAIVSTDDETYRGLKVERNSRCVTVHYTDGVTVDLMPVVRLAGQEPRVAKLFHSKPETGECYHKEVNPCGFAKHFNKTVELSATFQMRFDHRRTLVEGASFADQQAGYSVMEKADTQPMPDHVPLDQKAPRVVALQILKRFRDKRYRNCDDHKGCRKPPSIVMAALALEAPPSSSNLTDEVIAVATAIRNSIVAADRVGQLIEVRNPSHHPDLFTDRWPEDQSAQRLWAADLQHFIGSITELRRNGFDPVRTKRVFDDLFGEKVGTRVLEDHFRVQNKAIDEGRAGMTRDGRPVSPAMPAGAASAGKAGVAVAAGLGAMANDHAPSIIKPLRSNTGMGDRPR
ncbi:nucleotidyltransferase [Sphingomicrobium sp. XHP0239]|uniref:nucleotidyltransferase domain-containing protein n=1 Tax=Sphingomicrobium maritimum TaxID=3133972 RepID=UPI0031CC4635